MPTFLFSLFRGVNRSRQFQLIIGSGLVLLSISHWFPLGIQVLELLSAFAHFTILLACSMALISLWKRFWFLFGLSIIALLISATLVLPLVFQTEFVPEPTDLTVGQFNLYQRNPIPRKTFGVVSKTRCDILSIAEISSKWINILNEELEKDYPYSVVEPWDSCCYGMGFFSKYPISSHEVQYINDIPTIITQIEVGGRTITVLTIHTHPPAFPDETALRNNELEVFSEKLIELETPVLAVGDFNIVPWDRTFKSFIELCGLKLVRSGFQATFPMDLGFPLIPIDHILHTTEFSPTSCETVFIPGSDHKGIIAGFHIN